VIPDAPLHLVLALAAAAVAGAINSIAGGGTLVAFPAIVGLGVPPLVANATTTVALWPGSVGSMWGYRRELAGARAWAFRFAVPSLLGGATGALLLLRTSADRFERVVPYLVLAATLLFMAQGPIARWLGRRRDAAGAGNGELAPPPLGYLLYQFGVGVYGGYFGAGIGILMLAVLGAMGLTNIHQMNGLKNLGALVINAVAAILFAVSGIVRWPIALAMAAGGLVGGYGGALLAQRVPQIWVRRAITGVGLLAFVWLLLRR
jgi:uncharacterized membrane protein YfcA